MQPPVIIQVVVLSLKIQNKSLFFYFLYNTYLYKD